MLIEGTHMAEFVPYLAFLKLLQSHINIFIWNNRRMPICALHYLQFLRNAGNKIWPPIIEYIFICWIYMERRTFSASLRPSSRSNQNSFLL